VGEAVIAGRTAIEMRRMFVVEHDRKRYSKEAKKEEKIERKKENKHEHVRTGAATWKSVPSRACSISIVLDNWCPHTLII
jgi:hypothetical protein